MSPHTMLTPEQKALLRLVIDEEIARAKDISSPDDRLAGFFGGMMGRAGFDVRANKLDELWS